MNSLSDRATTTDLIATGESDGERADGERAACNPAYGVFLT